MDGAIDDAVDSYADSLIVKTATYQISSKPKRLAVKAPNGDARGLQV
jgi:hypothetical protein